MTESLRPLTSHLEEKLEHLQSLCRNPEYFVDVQVTMYYTASKNLYDAGWDTREHISKAFELLKRRNEEKSGI